MGDVVYLLPRGVWVHVLPVYMLRKIQMSSRSVRHVLDVVSGFELGFDY